MEHVYIFLEWPERYLYLAPFVTYILLLTTLPTEHLKILKHTILNFFDRWLSLWGVSLLTHIKRVITHIWKASKDNYLFLKKEQLKENITIKKSKRKKNLPKCCMFLIPPQNFAQPLPSPHTHLFQSLSILLQTILSFSFLVCYLSFESSTMIGENIYLDKRRGGRF